MPRPETAPHRGRSRLELDRRRPASIDSRRYSNPRSSAERYIHPARCCHHRLKHLAGWRLEQPEPGVLLWTSPTGHCYRSSPPAA